jgi:hypothetical protein
VTSNEELWHKTSQEPITVEIKRRKGTGLAIHFGNRTELLRRLHSNGIPRGSGNVVAQKRPGGRRLRRKQWRWERPGVKLKG